VTPQLKNLLEVVLERTGGGSFSDILSDTRGTSEHAQQRRIAMYLHWCNSRNLTKTGEVFKRDRTTVRHAVEQVNAQESYDETFKTKILNMRKAIASRNTIST